MNAELSSYSWVLLTGIEISSIADEEALRPEILTNEEKRLIEAYDNYIRLFPDDESTPKYLANAGAIYFNHKQFAEARVYFKTLVNRFPGAKEKTLAYRSIMDSYFYLQYHATLRIYVATQ